MQINGIGSNTTSGMYQNPNRKTNYDVPEKEKEDADLKQQTEIAQDSQYVQFIRSTPAAKKAEATPKPPQEELLSLGEWLKDILDRTKSFLTKIWTGGEAAGTVATVASEMADENPAVSESVMGAENTDVSESEIATENATVIGNVEAAAAVETQTESPWQKLRVRLEYIAGYLMKQFSGSDKADVHKNPGQDNGRTGQALGETRGQNDNIPAYMREHPDMGRMLRDEKYFTTTYNKKGQYTSFSAPPTRDSHVIDKDL